MKQWTALKIRQSKGATRLPCLTAYDYATARLVDAAGVPLVLVGDSLAMSVLGFATTVPATMEQMLHHTAAVVRGVKDALVVADMPFMSYQASDELALLNAGRFLKEAGADAVKIEGGVLRAELVRKLTANGVPVLGHIGLTPQSVLAIGGFKRQGRQPAEAAQLEQDALALSAAGVFAIVLECIPGALAEKITKAVPVPTIGIGAGAACDGQVLVLHDLLGLTPPESQPRFVKRYAELDAAILQAAKAYVGEVKGGAFPGPEHTYN
ncbi:MAG: 3-methyl-2-oxobutanoate hydroxymethyltransferase [Kiritimatiellae bacterium]|nr:3-methyl-2-oxobutanoate hydroxymethyltransferase [Kiritimatiellia bacterium]